MLVTSVHHISDFEPTNALDIALLKCKCAKRNFQWSIGVSEQRKQYGVSSAHTTGGGYAICRL